MNCTRIARVAAGAVALILALAFAAPLSTSSASPPQPGEVMLPKEPTCFGEYRNASDSTVRIVLEPVGDQTLVRVRTSAGWGAIGFIDVDHFEGVLRSADMQGAPLPGPFGRLEFDVQPDRWVKAVFHSGGDAHVERWVLVAADRSEYVGSHDELPEAIEKSTPAYPAAARRARIEGTVMVQALVGTDGLVQDARILKSIPELDDAAIAAVRRWKFKPGLSNGRPVAVWVAVPVRFTPK